MKNQYLQMAERAKSGELALTALEKDLSERTPTEAIAAALWEGEPVSGEMIHEMLEEYYQKDLEAARRYFNNLDNIRCNGEVNIHEPGTPDVPDLLKAGDTIKAHWGRRITAVVVDMREFEEPNIGLLPGAKSWTILCDVKGGETPEPYYLNQVVAVNGKLMPLYLYHPPV